MSQTKMFFILPLSLKVLFNLCHLCSKQETAYQNIEIKRKSQVSQVVFLPWLVHLSFYRYISLYSNLTETCSFEYCEYCFEYCAKTIREGIRQLKANKVACLNPTWNKLHQFSLSGSFKSWITKQYIQHLQYWR